MQDLADALALDRSTLGHNLRPLERDGLVAVEADARDRRIRRIRLLPAGAAKQERSLPLWRAAQERFDADFGRKRSRALRESLLAVAAPTASPLAPSPSEDSDHAG